MKFGLSLETSCAKHAASCKLAQQWINSSFFFKLLTHYHSINFHHFPSWLSSIHACSDSQFRSVWSQSPRALGALGLFCGRRCLDPSPPHSCPLPGFVFFIFLPLFCFSPFLLCSFSASQGMRSQSLDLENFESGVKFININYISNILTYWRAAFWLFFPKTGRGRRFLQHKQSFNSSFFKCFCPSGWSEVQAAVHRVSGYPGEHPGRQGYQTRTMAAQEASGRSAEPSPCGLLPEGLEDPAEGRY